MNRDEISSGLRGGSRRVAGTRQRANGDADARRCENARQRRDRAREREFMRMNYERMQALDQTVAEACR